MEARDTFANRLRLALENRDMLMADLARFMDIDRSAVTHYVTGRYEPGKKKLTQMAEILNVTEVWLMGYGEREDINHAYGSEPPKTTNIEAMVETVRLGLQDSSNGRLMLDGMPALPETIEMLRTVLLLDVEFAKRRNAEMHKKKNGQGGK